MYDSSSKSTRITIRLVLLLPHLELSRRIERERNSNPYHSLVMNTIVRNSIPSTVDNSSPVDFDDFQKDPEVSERN